MSNALKKITTRAKQLRKKHPNSKWTSLIKKAGAEYRNGKLGSATRKKVAKKKRSPNRQTGTSSTVYDKRRSARAPGKRRSASGRSYTERRKNRSDAPGKLTGVSASTLKSELKNRYKESLGKQLVRRELAPNKRARKKVQKQVLATKLQLRKLN